MVQFDSNSNSATTIHHSKPADTFQLMLSESIHRFFTEYRSGSTDFSHFTSIFSRLLQNLPDPPLEFVWFYSAVTFHSSNKFNSPNPVSSSKDLFQLLASCSTSCNAGKRISVLAPVIYDLYPLVFDRKELKREVESLLDGIVSYISICCGMEDDGNDDLSSRFGDLLRVWMVDRVGMEGEKRDDLKVFFPLVSEESRKVIRGGCKVRYLAGVVMCQAFLLRLCLKFGYGIPKLELENDLHDCAVQMITGFRSFHFLDIFLRMLLEPVLPVTSPLGHGNEVILRETLYDAVIKMDHAFLGPEGGILLPGRQVKDLALTWSFVADNAIRSVRENGNQTKAISYINAFSESWLLSQLIKWVTSQNGMVDKATSLNVSTPVALIKWLLIVEDQGVRIFECDISKVNAKAVLCKSRVEYEIPVDKISSKYSAENLACMVHERKEDKTADNDLEMIDSIDMVPLSAPCSMKSTAAADGVRKRKEGSNIEEEIPVKFIKYHLCENLVTDKLFSLANDDGLSCGNDVNSPILDEYMREMEQ
ncbi:hypothetical protein ERO13_D05G044800v2 [Gossypium hirsutum]|uniref:Uncharacterized protein n=1 Tax=Gossypium hirsutum TaxID=3635 RepID=A0A1U8JLT8_GOSHI|nr:uncharacterized protein LOC107906996 [Gossypium hirsutum]KAG4144559.1 hypothetical protein ERO13_D05G044800v2 [Gossypium hirsutum]